MPTRPRRKKSNSRQPVLEAALSQAGRDCQRLLPSIADFQWKPWLQSSPRGCRSPWGQEAYQLETFLVELIVKVREQNGKPFNRANPDMSKCSKASNSLHRFNRGGHYEPTVDLFFDARVGLIIGALIPVWSVKVAKSKWKSSKEGWKISDLVPLSCLGRGRFSIKKT